MTAQALLLIVGFGLVGFGLLPLLFGLAQVGAVVRRERPKQAFVVPLILAGAAGLVGAGFVQLSLPVGLVEQVFAVVNITAGIGVAAVAWRQSGR